MRSVPKISKEQKLLYVIILLFILTRLYLFQYLGIEFGYNLDGLIQFLDVNCLRQNLLQSIFYLHSQPPLFNLFIGVFEKYLPDYSKDIVQFIFLFMGLITNIALYKILLRMNINLYLSFILTIIYLITPATILYENLFFYTHIIIFFLILSCYFLLRFIQSKKFKDIFLFSSFLSLCVLTTSFFHVIWFFLIIITLICFYPKDKKVIIKSALVPVFLIAIMIAKNYLIFGNLNLSSWLGMNLYRITVNELSLNERRILTKDERLSKFSKFDPFPEIDSLESLKELKILDKTGIEVLDEYKKKSGHTNYNNILYLKVSKIIFKDDIYIITHYPDVYLKGVLKAFHLYFNPPTKYNLLEPNIYKIWRFNSIYNRFIYGTYNNRGPGLLSFFFISLMIIISIVIILNKNTEKSSRVVLVFLIFNILYVMLLGNFLEYGENNRFRYYTEIYHYIILGIILKLFIKNLQENK
ncbi:MAG: hypothetical protein B6D44_13450 [Ignavibacteriales bacterium UTCHB2]|nr:MAG: hypothetical protein BWY38_01558 [Ignavibacteria bacterium ADurb.Bin266]OQY71189.1 MAG: hypothetical protein B6D44_13450 [Ignavibacteriales bacterium UTCHB2]